ncbi:MAG: SDR family oxidoreductase [Candidatus Omnitrophica bacterium]|nr:SDR family oxidoreductase [Candidatus Omnitrophota bacterium]
MKKVLITGSNGLLGQTLIRIFSTRDDFECLATSRGENRASLFEKTRYEVLDITDESAVRRVMASFRPEAVIHTAALSQPDFCEKNPDQAWEVNAQGTENVALACEKYGAHLIHLSSDFIFDGKNGPYRETDLPHPLCHYAKTKWESEKKAASSKSSWTILRTCLAYGMVPNMSRSNILILVLKSLKNNRPLRIATDQIRTPTFIDDLAHACLNVALKKSQGIFHIAGPECMSVFEFAVKAADFFGLDRALIQPIETADLKEAAGRPLKTGFLVDKARNEWGFNPHFLQEGLAKLKLRHPEFAEGKRRISLLDSSASE